MTAASATATAPAAAFAQSPAKEPWSSPGTGERARTGIALIHGFTGSPVSLRPLAEMLASAGFSVELPRLPGHGTTWRDMIPTRYDDWRAHVVATVKGLRARTDRVVLLGLSMGGTLSLDVASGGGADVAGVISINAQILDRQGVIVKLGPYLEKVLPLVPASLAGLIRNDIAKPHTPEHAYAWVPSAAGNSLLRALPRVRGQLAHVPCPVLVMYSPNDHSVSPANSRALLRLIRCPELDELVLERSYHVATLDYDQELILERAIQFADRLRNVGRA
ncbi:MAG TPA: alpha/beta fold hydrolase [Polyangiaceae bacterium]